MVEKRLIVFLACIGVLVSGAWVEAIQSFVAVQNAQKFNVPFMFEGKDSGEAIIGFDRDQLSSRIDYQKQVFNLPANHLAVGFFETSVDHGLVLARTVFSGDVRLFRLDDGGYEVLPETLPETLAHQLPVAAQMFGMQFALVLYDRVKRELSLNIFDVVENQLDLSSIDSFPVVFGGPYELEIPLSLAENPLGLLICGGQTCFQYYRERDEQTQALEKFPLTDNAHLIEVASNQRGESYGLFLTDIDDRISPLPGPDEPVFFLAQLPEGELQALPADKIPMELIVNEDGPEVAFLQSERDISTMFFSDMENLALSGAMNLGADNIEGRKSWAQQYYLNGLMDLVAPKIHGSRFEFTSDQMDRLFKRLDLEMALFDRQLLEGPDWLYTRRYSLDREYLLSAVHVARALKTLLRYQEITNSSVKLASISRLYSALISSESRMDELVVSESEGSSFLRIKQGVPFLHDGLNVPYNVQNGWAEGIAMASRHWKIPEKQRNGAIGILKLFLENEAIQSNPPDGHLWPYWWGDGFTGYEESAHISQNSPSYEGYREIAHISYRSMDAMALLRGDMALEEILTDQDRLYLCQGVEEGGLYPFVSRELALQGMDPKIPFHIARLYARISAPWEIENAVWALASLSNGNFKGC